MLERSIYRLEALINNSSLLNYPYRWKNVKSNFIKFLVILDLLWLLLTKPSWKKTLCFFMMSIFLEIKIKWKINFNTKCTATIFNNNQPPIPYVLSCFPLCFLTQSVPNKSPNLSPNIRTHDGPETNAVVIGFCTAPEAETMSGTERLMRSPL